jgi:hypothetical protein
LHSISLRSDAERPVTSSQTRNDPTSNCAVIESESEGRVRHPQTDIMPNGCQQTFRKTDAQHFTDCASNLDTKAKGSSALNLRRR